jgi:TonB family protein
MHWKPKIMSRPPTFQLVERPPMPQPPSPVQAPPKPVETPKSEPKIEPKPVEPPKPEPKPVEQPKPEPKPEPKPQPKPEPKPVVEDDISDFLSSVAEPSKTLSSVTASEVSIAFSEPFPYDGYIQRLLARIRRRWSPTDKGEVIVQFTIIRSGSVEGQIRVVKNSGRGALDRMATQAVGLAAPFEQLPVDFPGQSLTIDLTLKGK